MTVKLAVLLSGGGTTLRNLLEKIDEGSLDAEVICVLSSRPGAKGLAIARDAGIPHRVVPRKAYATVDEFSQAITEYVQTKLKLGPEAARAVRLPYDYVREEMIATDVWLEPTEIEFVDDSFAGYVQMHALVKFNHTTNAMLESRWEEVQHVQRLGGVSVLAAGLLMLLAFAYSYMKIDLVTGGKYRGRLRFLAIAAILLICLAGLTTLRFASSAGSVPPATFSASAV